MWPVRFHVWQLIFFFSHSWSFSPLTSFFPHTFSSSLNRRHHTPMGRLINNFKDKRPLMPTFSISPTSEPFSLTIERLPTTMTLHSSLFNRYLCPLSRPNARYPSLQVLRSTLHHRLITLTTTHTFRRTLDDPTSTDVPFLSLFKVLSIFLLPFHLLLSVHVLSLTLFTLCLASQPPPPTLYKLTPYNARLRLQRVLAYEWSGANFIWHPPYLRPFFVILLQQFVRLIDARYILACNHYKSTFGSFAMRILISWHGMERVYKVFLGECASICNNTMWKMKMYL